MKTPIDRPLVMTELGLDSRRNGEEEQARSIDWQVRSAFSAGCAGTFVFAWTDQWHRGGYDNEDWDFGLTTRERRPKPALSAVSKAYAEVPFPPDAKWPKISVIVCTFNGYRTIQETMEKLKELDYPDYEVIVVNDGSTDHTPQIAKRYDVRLITTKNNGLSHARNVGWKAAGGEIVAYIDDDAYGLVRRSSRARLNASQQNKASVEPMITARRSVSSSARGAPARYPMKPPAKVSPAPVGSKTSSSA